VKIHARVGAIQITEQDLSHASETRAELKRIARRKAETENGGLNKRTRRQGPGSFRAMRPGNCGNLGNIGNVESVTCRPHYPGDGTNPPLSASLFCWLQTVLITGNRLTKRGRLTVPQ
jgi:hypothetical protein